MILSEYGLFFCFFLLSVAFGCAVYRMWRGPTASDRVIGFEVLSATCIAWLALFAVWSGIREVFNIVIIVAFLSFLGTMSFAFMIDKMKDLE